MSPLTQGLNYRSACDCAQALNNMANIDDNKKKIVDAGALPLYVKLLNPEYNESVQIEATRGLWSLAFACQNVISEEPGCRDGLCFFMSLSKCRD